MYPRINYEMTEADLEKILNACKPVPMIMLQCSTPSSPQENANRAWAELGSRMGFDSMTAEPIDGKSPRFFTAVPSENEFQKAIRVADENLKAKREETDRLMAEIKLRQERLTELLK